jgi:uncharacterized membrane protein
MSQPGPKKRYALYSLAILLLVLAAVGLYFGAHNFPIRSLALAAIMVSSYLVRASRVRPQQSFSPIVSDPGADEAAEKRYRRLLWILSLGLTALSVFAFLLMFNDTVTNGGNEVWPVYVFAMLALLCACAWGALVAKLTAPQ